MGAKPRSTMKTAASMVIMVVSEKAADTRSTPPTPDTGQAASMSGIRDSQGPKMKMMKSSQGLNFLSFFAPAWTCMCPCS